MATQDSLYDPYVKRGNEGAATMNSNSRTAQLQGEIDETVKTMQDNLMKSQQRGANLDDLQNRTDALATQANGFRRGANRVRKQMWWKDMKMRMCIIVGIILLLVVIIVPSVIASNKHH